MTGLSIRAAGPDDREAVTALWRECGLVVPHNDPAHDFDFALGKSGSDILLAVDGDRLTGSVMVGHDGHRGWLYYVSVASASRRRGIGRALVAAAEAWLAERGVPKAHLMVRESNEAVAAFYQRLGYETMPRINFQKWLKH